VKESGTRLQAGEILLSSHSGSFLPACRRAVGHSLRLNRLASDKEKEGKGRLSLSPTFTIDKSEEER